MEVSISEKAAPGAPRPLTCRQWERSDPQRHPVVVLQNCSRQDGWFPVCMKASFLAMLTLGAIRTLFELSVTRISSPYASWSRAVEEMYRMLSSLHRKGIVFLAIFTAVFAIRVLLKVRRKYVASHQREEEVKTVSGLIRQV